jgi:hypothetical protein
VDAAERLGARLVLATYKRGHFKCQTGAFYDHLHQKLSVVVTSTPTEHIYTMLSCRRFDQHGFGETVDIVWYLLDDFVC